LFEEDVSQVNAMLFVAHRVGSLPKKLCMWKNIKYLSSTLYVQAA